MFYFALKHMLNYLVGREFPYSNFKNVKGLKINLKSYYFTCLLFVSCLFTKSNRKSKIDLSLQIGKCIFSKTGFYFEIGTSSVTILPAFVHNNIESSQMLCWVYIYSRAIEITYFFPFLCQLMHATISHYIKHKTLMCHYQNSASIIYDSETKNNRTFC